jgi:hypothetical protein
MKNLTTRIDTLTSIPGAKYWAHPTGMAERLSSLCELVANKFCLPRLGLSAENYDQTNTQKYK